MLGRGLSPQKFIALLDEFRQKTTVERINARIEQVQQDELIALVKLQAEVKARYLVTVLDLISPKVTDLEAATREAQRYRLLAEEIGLGVQALVDGVVSRDIPMVGIEFDADYSPEVEAAIDAFIAAGAHDVEDM